VPPASAPAAEGEPPPQSRRRGGTVDTWPAPADTPARLEFWGDEIESLREFDPATQRSTNPLEDLLVPPSAELPLWRRQEVLAELRRLPLEGVRIEVREEWARLLEGLDTGEFTEGRELFAPYFHEGDQMPSLLD